MGSVTKQSWFNSWQGQNIFLYSSVQTDGRPIQPPVQKILGAVSSGVKQLGYEAHHLPLFSAKVKNM
jgi:hypothetical protein